MPKSTYQITAARSKGKKAFRVKYYAANGEMIASSEVVESLANGKKNVKAMIALCKRLSSVKTAQ